MEVIIMKLAKICLLANMLLGLSVVQAGFLGGITQAWRHLSIANTLKAGLSGVALAKAAMDFKLGYRGLSASVLSAVVLGIYAVRDIGTDMKRAEEKSFHDILDHIERRMAEKSLSEKMQQTTFEDIVGEIPYQVRILVDYLKNPSKYTEFGVSFSKGILLSGAPGTGKTLLARAVASEADVPFFYVSAQDILSKYIGESEKAIKMTFAQARKAADDQDKPFSIVFIDEIDGIGSVRSTDADHHDSNGVVDALITELDGFEQKGKVILMASTNMPKSIDPALKRNGRFNFKIEIPLPDKKGRTEIFKFYLDKYPFSGENRDKTIERLSEESHGFSPADIEAVISNAALSTVYADLDAITEGLLFAELRKVEKSEAAPDDLGMLYS